MPCHRVQIQNLKHGYLDDPDDPRLRSARQKSCLNSCLKHWKSKFESILISVKNPVSGVKESDLHVSFVKKHNF